MNVVVCYRIQEVEWLFIKPSFHPITKLSGREGQPTTLQSSSVSKVETLSLTTLYPGSTQARPGEYISDWFLHLSISNFDDRMDFLQLHKILDNFSIKYFVISALRNHLCDISLKCSREGDNMCLLLTPESSETLGSVREDERLRCQLCLGVGAGPNIANPSHLCTSGKICFVSQDIKYFSCYCDAVSYESWI